MSSALHVSFFGSSLVSAYWNGAATYYRGLIRALHERGHEITFYEPDAYERQQHRDMADPDWAKVVVYPAKEQADVLRAVEQARGSDVIIKASGVGVFDELLEAAVLDLQTSQTVVGFLDVDAPATLDRVLSNPQDYFRPLIPCYDLILTYGGGDPVVNAYHCAGARECIPVYNALDPVTHFPTSATSRFAADLAFLGNRMPDREERVGEFFLKPAAQIPGKKFLLGGNGWGTKTLGENVTYIGHVYTHEHNAFNCTPLAVLNVNRASMARYGFSPPTRVFEAAGAGACLITDQWEGIEMFLEPDTEILVAQNAEQVVGHLNSLTPDRARAIGNAAHRHIISEHTYAHRAAQLEQALLGRTQPVAL